MRKQPQTVRKRSRPRPCRRRLVIARLAIVVTRRLKNQARQQVQQPVQMQARQQVQQQVLMQARQLQPQRPLRLLRKLASV
jgi:hypothetical protein